jgi:hypothetical protein
MQCHAQLAARVIAQAAFDQCGRKAIEASRHRGVSGEKIAGAGGGKGGFEILAAGLHEAARAFQHGEYGVAFIKMADVGGNPQRFQHLPAADAKGEFLHQPHIRAATVKFGGNAPIKREIGSVVAVEQI